MLTRPTWVLPAAVLALTACKPKAPPELPDDTTTETSPGYESAAYSVSVQPMEVCEHLARLAAAEAGVEPQYDPALMADCERELSLEAAARGTANWNSIAGCVLQSRTETDIDACDRANPMPDDAQPAVDAPDDDGAERAACDHMLEIILLETAAELGEVPRVTQAEQRQLSDECVAALWYEQRPDLSDAEYGELLRCITAAQTGDQIQEC